MRNIGVAAGKGWYTCLLIQSIIKECNDKLKQDELHYDLQTSLYTDKFDKDIIYTEKSGSFKLI